MPVKKLDPGKAKLHVTEFGFLGRNGQIVPEENAVVYSVGEARGLWQKSKLRAEFQNGTAAILRGFGKEGLEARTETGGWVKIQSPLNIETLPGNVVTYTHARTVHQLVKRLQP